MPVMFWVFNRGVASYQLFSIATSLKLKINANSMYYGSAFKILNTWILKWLFFLRLDWSQQLPRILPSFGTIKIQLPVGGVGDGRSVSWIDSADGKIYRRIASNVAIWTQFDSLSAEPLAKNGCFRTVCQGYWTSFVGNVYPRGYTGLHSLQVRWFLSY